MKHFRYPRNARDYFNKLIIHPCVELLIIGLFVLITIPTVQAATYPLPEKNQYLIGKTQYIKARKQDTLLDIARSYDLGFNEITAANPHIDPWLPEPGARIMLPTRFILPEGPREGILVNLAEMRLYYFPEVNKGEVKKVITHPIGIGRQGWATPVGSYHVVMKIENPGWTMPMSVYKESVANGLTTRRYIPPGPDNPLGKFAIQLNADGLLIHGTNTPFSIGMRVSRGCLRLYPEDIRTLVKEVPKGTPVYIVEQSYKLGYEDDILFLEAHEPVGFNRKQNGINLTPVVSKVIQLGINHVTTEQWNLIVNSAARHTGVPVVVLENKSGQHKTSSVETIPNPFTLTKQ